MKEGKIGSAITGIKLNTEIFVDGGEPVSPTFINFFFGNNGTGKTSISRAIRDSQGITFASDKSGEDYKILVFNQDYISDNFESYKGLKGVFTVGKENIAIQKKLDEKIQQLAEQDKIRAVAVNEASQKLREQQALDNDYYEKCWKKKREYSSDFEKALSCYKRSKQKFAEDVSTRHPDGIKIEELRRYYASVFSSEAKTYEKFGSISDVKVLDSIPGREIMELRIVNAADTDIGKHLQKLGATEWAHHGHEQYGKKAGNKCPYCAQVLPDGFEEMFVKSFDSEYKENIKKIAAFLERYRGESDALYAGLAKTPSEVYPEVATLATRYREQLDALKGIIANNIVAIMQKTAEPSLKLPIQDTGTALKEISETLTEINKLIEENNLIVKKKEYKEGECKELILRFFASELQEVTDEYKKNRASLQEAFLKQKAIIKEKNQAIDAIRDEIKDLSAKTVETESAMNNINGILRDTGFTGIKVRPQRETLDVVNGEGKTEKYMPIHAVNYEVIRTETEEIADKLSEGEKNFLAFLYFYQRVFGSDSEIADFKDKIVVIDDPVSSMDSGALFVVSALVRKMVEICKNNVSGDNRSASGNFIKQIFVLTHNVYFHREVTYAFEDFWECVSFFHIRKIGNRSRVALCTKPDPNRPSVLINNNPVHNSYWALWEEYRVVETAIPLINVIRRILEYYFLQLTGYDGGSLRDKILVSNREKFVDKDDSGKEDTTRFDMAASMLSYLHVSATGVNDGMYYVDEGMDVGKCRYTFEKIFECMEQKQHFDMMMKSVGGTSAANHLK